MKEKVETEYFNKKQRYGNPRLTMELQAQGIKISRITIAKYMKEMGLRSKLARAIAGTMQWQKASLKLLNQNRSMEISLSLRSKWKMIYSSISKSGITDNVAIPL